MAVSENEHDWDLHIPLVMTDRNLLAECPSIQCLDEKGVFLPVGYAGPRSPQQGGIHAKLTQRGLGQSPSRFATFALFKPQNKILLLY